MESMEQRKWMSQNINYRVALLLLPLWFQTKHEEHVKSKIYFIVLLAQKSHDKEIRKCVLYRILAGI